MPFELLSVGDDSPDQVGQFELLGDWQEGGRGTEAYAATDPRRLDTESGQELAKEAMGESSVNAPAPVKNKRRDGRSSRVYGSPVEYWAPDEKPKTQDEVRQGYAAQVGVPVDVVTGAFDEAEQRTVGWLKNNPGQEDQAKKVFETYADSLLHLGISNWKEDNKGVVATLKGLQLADAPNMVPGGLNSLATGVNELLGNKYAVKQGREIQEKIEQHYSPALRNERSYTGKVVKSAGESFVQMLASAPLGLVGGAAADAAIMSTNLGRAATLSAALADKAPFAARAINAIPGVTTAAVSEGVPSALGGASQAGEEFDAAWKKTPQQILESPAYKEALDKTGNQDEALALVRSTAVNKGAAYQGLATVLTAPLFGGGLVGSMASKAFGRAERAASNSVVRAASPVLREAGQETGQSYFEQVGGNLAAKQTYNPNVDLTEGAIEQAALGAGAGALTAGGVHVMSGGHATTDNSSYIKERESGDFIDRVVREQLAKKTETDVSPMETSIGLAMRKAREAKSKLDQVAGLEASAQQEAQQQRDAAIADIGAQDSVESAIGAANRSVSINSDSLLNDALASAGIGREELETHKAQARADLAAAHEEAAAAQPAPAEQTAQTSAKVAQNDQQAANATELAQGQPKELQTPVAPQTESPTKVWYGRRGDGYQNSDDAMRALKERQRLSKGLDWAVQQTPDGRFYLSGTQAPVTGRAAVATQPTPAAARVESGKAKFLSADAAQEFVNSNALADTHEVVRDKGEFHVRVKPVSQTTPAPATRVGRDFVPMDEGGKPFATQRAAKSAQQMQPHLRVVKHVGGGFELAPKSAAQLAAQGKSARRLAQARTGEDGPQSALAFILSRGGLSASTKTELGLSQNQRIGNRYLFAGQSGGLTLEQAAIALHQAGHISDESESAAARAINDHITTGRPTYTPAGWEAIGQAESEARFADHLAAQQEATQADDPFGPLTDFTQEEQKDSGYAQADAQLQAEVRALVTMAESIGIDADSIMEDAHYASQTATEQEFYESAKHALEAAIEGSHRDSRAPAGGQSQTAARAEEQAGAQAVERGADGPDFSKDIADGERSLAELRERRQSLRGDARRLHDGRIDRLQKTVDDLKQQQRDAAPALTAPTKQDVLAQQDAKANEAKTQERDQIKRESEAGAGLFELASEEGRQDSMPLLFSRKSDSAENEAERQFRETERALGGRKAYDQAKAEGKTKLTYGQWVQVRTPNFKKWFDGSKVVDPQTGEPMVMYHGTATDFETFDNARTGTNDLGLWGRGHYFAAAAESANSYALRQGDGAQVMPVYVAIKNPLVLRTGSDLVTRMPDGTNSMELVGHDLDGSKIKEIALSGGHDGTVQFKPNGLIGDVVAYSPEQIKSASGNSGQFDPNRHDIRFSRSSATQAAYEARIDALFAGEKAAGPNKGARVLDRSDVLAMLGLGDGPVQLAESKVAHSPTNHPRMTAAQWKKVPQWLDNPAAVFDSETVRGALVLIAPETINGATVRMTVMPRKGGGADVHILTNADDAPGFTPFARWFRDGMARMVDQKAFPAVLGDSGLQLSSSTWQNKPGTRKILTEKDLAGWRKANNPAYSFAGQNAATADQHALASAQQRLGAGEDAEIVRQDTGWSRGLDGKWRFEISDKDAKLAIGYKGHPIGEARNGVAENNGWMKLGDVLDHPALFAAYPQLSDARVKLMPTDTMRGSLARINPHDGSITLDESMARHEALSALLHEIQHNIQSIEGFAAGGSYASAMTLRQQVRQSKEALYRSPEFKAWRDQQDELIDALDGQELESALNEHSKKRPGSSFPRIDDTETTERIYLRLAGEVEARNTQARQRLTDEERRATPPSATADVADSDVIVTFNGQEAHNAPAPANAIQQGADHGKQNSGIPAGLPARKTLYSGRLERIVNDELGRTGGPSGFKALAIAQDELPDAIRSALAEFARVTGTKVSIFRNLTPEVTDFNGVTVRDGVLFINEASDNPATSTAAHEWVHNLRKTHHDLYGQLAAEVRRQGDADGFASKYGYDANQGEEELTAAAVGDAMTDPVFLQRLADKNTGLFKRAAKAFLKFLDTLTSGWKDQGSKEFLRDVEAFRDTLAEVLDLYDTGNETAPRSVDDAARSKILSELGKIDKMFALPKSSQDTVAGIAADNDPGIRVSAPVNIAGRTEYTLTTPSGKKATLAVRDPNPYGESVYDMRHTDEGMEAVTGRPGENPEDVPPTGDVWIDVSKLMAGDEGAKIYNIAATFAHNTRRIFIGDPAGLSKTALRRRLEQMISSAMKFGTTAHLAPHPDQTRGGHGVPPLRWVYGDDVGNLERMIAASVQAMDNAFPTSKTLEYDPDTQRFRNAHSGRTFDGRELAVVLGQPIGSRRAVGETGAGKAEAGWRTVARAAVFRALLRETGGDGQGGNGQRGQLLGRFVERHAQVLADSLPNHRIFYSRKGRNNTATQGQRFTLNEETKFQKARRRGQDYFLRALVAQNAVAAQGGTLNEQTNFYLAEELSHGRRGALSQEFARNTVQPLMEKAVKLGVALDELALYAYAKHAPERNAKIAQKNPRFQDGGSGMTNADAKAIIDKVRQEGREQAFEDLHGDLMGIGAANRRVMLDEGLITQDEYGRLENDSEFYIPLRGFEKVDDKGEKVGGRSSGKGINIRGPETMKALGRESRAGQLIENLIVDHLRTIDRSERNQVGKVFLNFVLQNPDPDLWQIDATKTRQALNRQTGQVEQNTTIDKGEDTVSVKVNGREIYIKIHDPLLARAMRKAHKDETGETERLLMKTAGMYTSLLRNTLTRYNPEFALTNALRDFGFGTAAMVDVLGEKGAAKFAAAYAGAVAASHRHEGNKLDPQQRAWDKTFMEFKMAGGMTAGFYVKNTDEIGKDIRGMMLDAGAQKQGFTEWFFHNGGAKAVKVLGRVFEYAGSVSENAARVAAFKVARDMGKSPSDAATLAKNLTTNFDRKGEIGQLVNTFYVFYNAAVQGTHRLAKMAQNPKMWAYAAGFGASAIALALANAGRGGDDPDDGIAYWDKIPDFDKERNLIIMLPPGDQMEGAEKVGTKGRYIKIPLQYGLNVPIAFGYVIADLIRNRQDKTRGLSPVKAAVTLASYTAGAFNPFGGSVDLSSGSSMAQAVLPSLGDVVYQFATGTNGFGRDVAPFKSPFDTKPDSENYNLRQADSASLKIARWLNSVTGGSRAESGKIDISAGTVDNVIRTLTGGTGQFINDSINLAMKAVDSATGGDPDLFSRDVPLARRVYGDLGGDVDQGIFYESRKKSQEAAGVVRRGAELGMEPSEENARLAGVDKHANKVTRALSEIRHEMIRVTEDADMTKGDKTIRLRELRATRDRITANYNRAFTEFLRSEVNH